MLYYYDSGVDWSTIPGIVEGFTSPPQLEVEHIKESFVATFFFVYIFFFLNEALRVPIY